MSDMTDSTKRRLDRVEALREATRFARTLGHRTGLDWSPTWETHLTSHAPEADWTWGAVLRFGTGRLTVLRLGDAYEWRVELLETGVTYEPEIGPFPRDPVVAAAEGLRDAARMVQKWRDVIRDADVIAADLDAMIEHASNGVRDEN